MAAKLQEITGTFLREDFRFNNADGDTIIGSIWVNGEVCQELSVKGQADLDELQPQQTYRFYGKPGTYKNKRTGEAKPQFTFDSFVLEQPRSKSGVIGYLRAAGEGHNFGPARALKCWELYGSEAVKICREESARVADELSRAGLKISDEQMAKVAAVLEQDAALEGCTLELMDLLAGRGFPKGTSRLATRQWGNRAALKIRRNPYSLMLFRGCGFKRCDALYLDLKLDPARIRRQGLCAWYTLARDTEGHTYHPVAFAEAGIRGNVAATKIDFPKAIRFAKLAGMVAEVQTKGRSGPLSVGGETRWLGEGKKARNEADLAECLSIAAAEVPMWANFADGLSGITEHQREHLRKALQGTVGILGGSPGTGKTYALAALAKYLCEILGPEQVLIGAPTGKAAVRVTENLSKYGLPLRARTWHSLLMLLDRQQTKHFLAKVLIGDECFPAGTLVDTPLGRQAIETLVPGNLITNAIGTDRIVATNRKEVSRAVRINAGETSFICSENHPIFTARGVVVAAEIRPGDAILSTGKAMRLLRQNAYSQKDVALDSFLQHVLLDEMVDEFSGFQEANIYGRTCEKERDRQKQVSSIGFARSESASSANQRIEPNVQHGNASKSVCCTSEKRPQTTGPGWERQASAEGTSRTFAGSRGRLENGVCCNNGCSAIAADTLQDRLSSPEIQGSDRSGRGESFSSESERKGREKNCIPGFARVEGVAILEQGSPELDQFRNADGQCYFYDLQAERHQSYSVNGLLVHNCSMCDTDLTAALFRARAVGTHVLLVGDVNQLPPVGHGAPLRDVITAGLPYGELREIMRNSGGIVEACAAIRDAKAWHPGDNLRLVTATFPQRQIDEMLKELRQYVGGGGGSENGDGRRIDPIWDCQVVVPVNKKSPLARKELNKILQAELNPNGGTPGCPFRTGDKIVNTKNGYFPPAGQVDLGDDEETATNDRGEVYVANGELGEVLEVEEKLLVVKLSNPSRTIRVPRGKANDGEGNDVASEDGGGGAGGSDSSDMGTGCSWDLGYALSVHKSQGSEWPVVIVMLDDYAGARMVCSREWLYTAISRAKDQCVLIGKRETANAMCRSVALGKRKTFLRERILQKQAERVLVDL